MASNRSISISAVSCTEQREDTLTGGYALKQYRLNQWIYEKHYTQPYVANAIGLSLDEFKQKLRKRGKFSRKQITALVYLMGAKAAFRVLYFPSKHQRRRVWREVFGQERGEEQADE